MDSSDLGRVCVEGGRVDKVGHASICDVPPDYIRILLLIPFMG